MKDLSELLTIVVAASLLYLISFTEIPLKAVRNVEAALDRAYLGENN